MQVGCGMVSVDYVAVVDSFPNPDDKMRTRRLQVTISATTKVKDYSM